MEDSKVLNYIKEVVKNTPADWLKLTTHRLDIYHEELAKTEFIQEFEKLYEASNNDKSALEALPTAYDYIRLGHPLSSVLEWAIAKLNNINSESIISFSSRTIPILAILRKNHFDHKPTQILYTDKLPTAFDEAAVKKVYGYQFELKQLKAGEEISAFEGSTVLITNNKDVGSFELNAKVDFSINLYDELGSILVVNGQENQHYISDIQHVRRRETIAMTPADCYTALQQLVGKAATDEGHSDRTTNKTLVLETIEKVTAANTDAILGSCGLSVQYAIMMGLIDDALEQHPDKAIKIIVPPNCYGGTNDQARRVAAAVNNVEILDLPVDGDNDMVRSTDKVLTQVAEMDAIPYIIAEIPTNPRVEVPNLEDLRAVLSKKRLTPTGNTAIEPVFILDQTFCPNVQFLGKNGILSSIKTISYVSGSKFPSGGKCTAGYCVANDEAAYLMEKIDKHMQLCDNEATDLQVSILAEQLPSMNQRIADAYKNTREFVSFIEKTLPTAKINFVSEELAARDFTPSVFSLDLPTKGDTEEEREAYKRALNQKLIDMMITQIPNESKYCVSYGQLKGCYWTIPATSTQGTTKESDKDYIARVSVSPDLDLDKHKAVFKEFVENI
jgi:cystathionine beta-lyase/cystathionine gamma-synthase